MPFIEEQDLIYLHKQIETEIEERNKLETRYRNKSFQYVDTKRKAKMYQIISALLLLGLLGAIGYAFKQSIAKTVAELTPQEVEVKVNKYLEEQGMAAIPKDSLDNLNEIAFNYEMMDNKSDDENSDSNTNTDNQSTTNNNVAQSTNYTDNNPFEGYVYSVGIGSLKRNAIKMNSEEFSNFKRFQGRLDLYSIGNFKSYKEATAFKLNVRKYLHIRDAYLVAYKDGKNVSVKEALAKNGK